MKTFSSMKDAFEWWLKDVYPELPADQKNGKYRNAWRDYTFNKGISEKRMRDVLSDFGAISVKTVVTFNPK
jgi:hypothetical protein